VCEQDGAVCCYADWNVGTASLKWLYKADVCRYQNGTTSLTGKEAHLMPVLWPFPSIANFQAKPALTLPANYVTPHVLNGCESKSWCQADSYGNGIPVIFVREMEMCL
jgi:hypothetical protein